MYEFLRGRVLLTAALAFIGGILSASTSFFIFLLILITSVSLTFKQRNIMFFVLIFGICGAGRMALQYQYPQNHIKNTPNREVREIVGIVETDPKPSGDGYSWELEVKQANRIPAVGRMVVFVSELKDPPKVGNQVKLTGKIKLPEQTFTPGLLNYRGYLALKNIHRTISSKSAEYERISSGRLSFNSFTASIRNKLSERMHLLLPPEYAGLLNGMLFGAQDEVSDNAKLAFKITGVYHLLSVSGFHVMALWWLVKQICGLLKIRRQHSAVILILALIAYCSIVGGGAPAVRAGIMLGAYSCAFLFKREPDILSALAFSAFVYLLYNPLSVFEIGFQFSYITLAICILWTKPFADSIGTLTNPLFKKMQDWFKINENFTAKINKGATNSLAISITACVGTGPLLIHYYSRLSLLGPISNLLTALPVVALFAVTPLVLILSAISIPVSKFAASLLITPLLNIFMNITYTLSKFDWLYLNIPSPPFYYVVIAYLLIFMGAKVHEYDE